MSTPQEIFEESFKEALEIIEEEKRKEIQEVIKKYEKIEEEKEKEIWDKINQGKESLWVVPVHWNSHGFYGVTEIKVTASSYEEAVEKAKLKQCGHKELLFTVSAYEAKLV